MSVHVMSWVLKKSPAKGTDRLVLLVLADHASEDGTDAWAAVKTIAHEARCSERAVQYALGALEDGGAICEIGVHSSGTKVYRVLMDELAERYVSKRRPRSGGVQHLHPGADSAGAQNATSEGATCAPGGVQNAHDGGATCAPGGVQPLHPNRPEEPSQGTVQEEPPRNRTEEAAEAASSSTTNSENAEGEENDGATSERDVVRAKRAASIEQARQLWPRLTTDAERALLRCAAEVAVARGDEILPWVPETVVGYANEFADRDLLREAHKWRNWHCPNGLGENKPVRNLTASLREWLDRAPTLGTVVAHRDGPRSRGDQVSDRVAEWQSMKNGTSEQQPAEAAA